MDLDLTVDLPDHFVPLTSVFLANYKSVLEISASETDGGGFPLLSLVHLLQEGRDDERVHSQSRLPGHSRGRVP